MLFCNIAFLVLARLQQHLIRKSAGLANALRFTTNLTQMVLVCAYLGTSQSVFNLPVTFPRW